MVSPSASAVTVSPTLWAPVMAGRPVAGWLPCWVEVLSPTWNGKDRMYMRRRPVALLVVEVRTLPRVLLDGWACMTDELPSP